MIYWCGHKIDNHLDRYKNRDCSTLSSGCWALFGLFSQNHRFAKPMYRNDHVNLKYRSYLWPLSNVSHPTCIHATLSPATTHAHSIFSSPMDIRIRFGDFQHHSYLTNATMFLIRLNLPWFALTSSENGENILEIFFFFYKMFKIKFKKYFDAKTEIISESKKENDIVLRSYVGEHFLHCEYLADLSLSFGNCNRTMKIDSRCSPHLDIVPCIGLMVNSVQLIFWYCHNILAHHNFRVLIEYRWNCHYSMICVHYWRESMGSIAYIFQVEMNQLFIIRLTWIQVHGCEFKCTKLSGMVKQYNFRLNAIAIFASLKRAKCWNMQFTKQNYNSTPFNLFKFVFAYCPEYSFILFFFFPFKF